MITRDFVNESFENLLDFYKSAHSVLEQVYLDSLSNEVKNSVQMESIELLSEGGKLRDEFIKEIRLNLLNWGTSSASEYRRYILKMMRDTEKHFDALPHVERFLKANGYNHNKDEEIFEKVKEDNEPWFGMLAFCHSNFQWSWREVYKATEIEFQTYIQPIDGKQENDSAELTTNQKILLLHKLGFFDLQSLSNIDRTRVAKIVSKIISRSEKNTYDAIGERYRGSLEKSQTSNEVVAQLLEQLNSSK